MLALAATGNLVAFYGNMPKLLKLKFYPSYSAFTFPCVISAIAIKTVNGFLVNSKQVIPVLKFVVKFEELLAVVIVLYVVIRYIDFLFINRVVKAPVKAGM